MPEYVMRFQFAAPDDDHALRWATAMAGMMVAEWENNGVTWEGVSRSDGTRVQPQSGQVDPVLVCAAWGGQAQPIVGDEDMEGVVARITAELQRQAHGSGPHRYLSTGCLHGEHGYCKAMTGHAGAKRPARCKFCDAKCICPCHQDTGQAGIEDGPQ